MNVKWLLVVLVSYEIIFILLYSIMLSSMLALLYLVLLYWHVCIYVWLFYDFLWLFCYYTYDLWFDVEQQEIIDWRTRYLEHVLHCFGRLWSSKHNSLCKCLFDFVVLMSFANFDYIYFWYEALCPHLYYLYFSLRRLWIFMVLKYFIILLFF